MDYIIVHGDGVKFEKTFGAATVDVQDGTMVGSGHGSIDGAAICVDGDEAKVSVGPVPYSSASFSSVKGAGLLTIDSLAGDQLASQTTTGDAKVILLGKKFNAKFTVTVPAQQQSGSTMLTDSMTEYKGFGKFENANEAVRGE